MEPPGQWYYVKKKLEIVGRMEGARVYCRNKDNGER
jgi:hypothetical protein